MVNSSRNRNNASGRAPSRLIHWVLKKENYNRCFCTLLRKFNGQFLNSLPLRKHYCLLLSILIPACVLPLTLRNSRFCLTGFCLQKTNIYSCKISAASCTHFYFRVGKVLFTFISGPPSPVTSLLSYIITNLVPCGLLFYH